MAGAFAGIEFPGRIDPHIVAEALARHGIDPRHPAVGELRALYFAHLAEQLRRPGGRALPGVVPLLDRLSSRDDVQLALVTGNYEVSARLKLEAYDLSRYFRFGAFGDDADDRDGLVPVALDRATTAGARVSPRRTVVVGDTPRDVRCARSGGVRAIGVATGGISAAELRAAGADLVFDDLSRTDDVIAAIDALTRDE